MVKKKLILFTLILTVLSNCPDALAVYKVVIDPFAVAAVNKNMASQALIEGMHNSRLDSIAKRQEKIAQFTTTMATVAELYKLSKENIEGFGVESKYYVEIGLNAYEIVTRLPGIMQNIKKSKMEGKIACLARVDEIYAKTCQLVGDFVNIVNNAKVESPLKSASFKKSKDGYNFLDRNTRLNLAIRIYSDLRQLRDKTELLGRVAYYATWGDVVRLIDSKTWCTYMDGKVRAKAIASQWKSAANKFKF